MCSPSRSHPVFPSAPTRHRPNPACPERVPAQSIPRTAGLVSAVEKQMDMVMGSSGRCGGAMWSSAEIYLGLSGYYFGGALLSPPKSSISVHLLKNLTQSLLLPSHSSCWPIIMSHSVPRFQQRSCVHSSAPVNVPADGSYDTANPGYIRKYLRSYGLTPPRVESYETQKTRCLRQLAVKATAIDKFLYLSTLRRNNVHLFYRLVVDHLKELTPLIYTPVVGEACQRWSEIYQQPEGCLGMYISYEDRGNIAAVIQNWPQPHVDITVITDGSRILGLGDLGINGMGIPIGKLALYTACAGIRPEATLPLTLDLGTSNKALREDPLYLGSRRNKVSPEQELEFMDELMTALTEKWPGEPVRLSLLES
ncbi:NADP-dependent malic enzyme [Histoplasma capsulatum H143]|uniref:NADP-dependent malic enzyme n=1 Tax=Ajellomyces capsulatus (strain H143) TaxID=544712 RepID=C6H4U3_AJECH|nr:NADP-dependent malic enzyme [Histoplasma capsulatum H143]